MNNYDIEELIDRYVMNHMDADERRGFEERMNEDDALREEVDMMRIIVDSLERRSSNEEKMAMWRMGMGSGKVCAMPARDIKGKNDGELLKVKKRIAFRIVGIWAAACVMLGVFLGYPYSYWGLQDDDVMAYISRTSGVSYSDAIETMWDAKAYAESITYIDSAIAELMEIEYEDEYDVQTRDFDVYCLSWARIQTLLKMRDYKSAYDSLEDFMIADGVYKEEAEKLYNKLRIRMK